MEKKFKDPNKPKRPTSAYFYFVAKERELAKGRGEDISRVAEWTKMISGKWRELTAVQKKPFDAQAATDRSRYEREMGSYTGPGAKRPKDENKPKRAQSAYFLFLADFRVREKDNFKHEGGHKDLIRAAGEAWNKLSSEDKKPYEKKHLILKDQYDTAMAEYAAGGASAAKKTKANNGAAQDVEDDDEDDEEEEEDSD
jgi:hypothetical protein